MRPVNLVNKEIIAIDIGQEYLKVGCTKAYGIKREVSELFLENIKGLSGDDIAERIKKCVNSKNLSKNSAVICPIANGFTITKNIEIPSRDIREVESIIKLQAGRLTPYSRDEIIVGYVDVGLHKEAYTKILLIIVNRNIITRHLEILNKAGLKPERMIFSPEPLSVMHPMLFKEDGNGFPIVGMHVDNQYTDFIVIFRNKVIFTRNIPIGSEHFQSDKERAEEKFIEEIRLSIEAYQSEDVGSIPNKIFILGATEDLASLEEKANSFLHIPVKIVPYFSHLPLSDKAVSSILESKRISFFNVISSILSLEYLKVNLLPEEVKFRYKIEQRSKELVKSGIYVISLALILCSTLITNIYFKSLKAKRLDYELSRTSDQAQEIEKSMTKLRIMKDYISSQGQMLNVLAELSDILPENIYFSDINFSSNEEFSIKGLSDSTSAVFAFVGTVEQSPYFEKVNAKYTSKRRENDKDMAIFEIVGVLKKDKND